MRRLNLSEWAIDHRFLVAYLVLVLVLVLVLQGVASCLTLKWSEDADGFSRQELPDHVDDVRKRLLQLPDMSKIDVLGPQGERVHVEFSTERLAGLGTDGAAPVAALQAQGARP